MPLLVAILSCLLSSPSYPVRDAAHAALSLLATPADLCPLLDSPDPETRMRAGLLLDDVGHASLRRELAAFASLPYIDADPEWTSKGLQRYLALAQAWHRERQMPMGEPDWSEYRQAWRLALDAGDVTADPVTVAVMMRRTACYRACRLWVMPP